jgi:hypothetical protein
VVVLRIATLQVSGPHWNLVISFVFASAFASVFAFVFARQRAAVRG